MELQVELQSVRCAAVVHAAAGVGCERLRRCRIHHGAHAVTGAQMQCRCELMM
jgi:hypothetical protein